MTPHTHLLDESPCLEPSLFESDPNTVLAISLPFDSSMPMPSNDSAAAAVVSSTTPTSRRPRARATTTTTATPTKLSKRVQRVMRTREAASRNRSEQRAKMLRLTTDNARLQAQTIALAAHNKKLKADVRLMLALKADPDLLRRVLAQAY